ncbi:MAG: low molecular weight phosphotyrosine protein phosphatase [Lewinellaceae bacterium]|nr:low molecular weight phosphotyrosine protein phosphatase [Saprospiraceae bacterium]MCB9332375.1 low molecular weight phosphotyrosine protein phosphatase [Lewinellaceae bacterium]
MRVLMVCLGNICRSPLAEGILKHKVEQHGMDWEVDSAGTGNWHVGELPDHRSIATARQYDIDITYQRARQFRTADFEHFDRIFVMDTQNYRDVLRLAQNDAQREKVQLILDLTHPGENRSVPDPYWDDDGFEHVFQLLDAACGKLIQR